jgi:hypothetical protein
MAAMNAAIFVHCLIAYQVMINVWSASALHIFAPRCVCNPFFGAAARRVVQGRPRKG